MEPLLSVKNLSKFYHKRQVLFNVNLDCYTGQIVGLIGANGAGKTTIMKSILGLIKSDGQITVNGKKISFNRGPDVSSVGSLIEYPGIYPFLSGRDHLKVFSKNKQNIQIEELIAKLKMSEYIDNPAGGYSLGMKQKLGIAMALVNNPKFVVLDEPMNGLDPQATKDLRDLIQQKAKTGVGFLISSHLLAELQKLADDIIILRKGQILKNISMKNLLQESKTSFKLKTDNDFKAEQILKKAGYRLHFENSLRVFLDKNHDLNDLISLLENNNIIVKDIIRTEPDLEKLVLEVIN